MPTMSSDRFDTAMDRQIMVREIRRPSTAHVPRVPDSLWSKLRPLIEQADPPARRSGRRRIDHRAALDAIIYRELTGCSWNRLPNTFPDDSSVHRTYRRWQQLGLLDQLWTTIVEDYQ